MQLEQRDKELAAIGAAIGCNCRPCIEHHILAGRAAGLSDAELVEAVAAARAVRDEAIRLPAPRIDELLGGGAVRVERERGGNVALEQRVRVGAHARPQRDERTRPRHVGDQRRLRARRGRDWGGVEDGRLLPEARR